MPRTICVDADNTVFTFDVYEKNKFGEPIKEMIEELKKLKDKGYTLVLSTARGEDELKALKEKLEEFELSYLFDKVVAGKKEPALAYLDDRAVNVLDPDWVDKLEELLKNRPERHPTEKSK